MIHSPTHTILAGEIASISPGHPNHNHPRFFLQSFSAPYQNQTQPSTYPCVQAPAPPQSNPSFEDNVLQALKGLEMSI